MNYIYFWLLLGKIEFNAADEFKKAYPNIMDAFSLNNDNYHRAKLDDNLWLPEDQEDRQDVACGHNMPRICENLFSYYAKDFKQEKVGLSVDDELEECGKANTTKMKNAIKAIRADKGSVAPGRTKRIIFNDGDLSPNANQAEYPWTVFIEFAYFLIIYYEEPARGAGIYHETFPSSNRCTGAIIHRQFILTSAHCIASRDKNIDDNMAIKSPDHSDHEYVRSKYLQRITRRINKSRNTRLTPGQVTITSVWANLTKVTINYGPISIDKETGVAWDVGNEPIVIHGANENVEVHSGYIRDLEILEMKRARDSGEQGLPQEEPPDFSLNEVAIIYLGPDKTFKFSDKVRPVCLPAPAGDHKMPDFKRCSMRFGEEFHLAGYGHVSEHPKIRAKGLSRLRAKVREVHFAGYEYYGSVYTGMPRSFQDRNLSRKEKNNLSVKQRKKLAQESDLNKKGEHDKIITTGLGDSGAPWLVQRYHHRGQDPDDTRIFAMAIHFQDEERDDSIREYMWGTDTLMLGRWIRDTMINFRTNNHKCQKWVAPGELKSVVTVGDRNPHQSIKRPPPGEKTLPGGKKKKVWHLNRRR